MEGKLAEELYAESLKVSKLELSSNLADDQGDKLNGNKILYQWIWYGKWIVFVYNIQRV